MYESYWGLKVKPFQNTSDPRFIYYTAQHKDALWKLDYVIKEKMGCGLLVGLWGCGKTTILHTLLETLTTEKYWVIWIDYPPRNQIELLTELLAKLGGRKISSHQTDLMSNVLMNEIKDCLMEHHKEGKEIIVILDEAHLIKDSELLEELRLLLNLQLKNQFLLTLILSGQSELQESINKFKQFEQRIAVKCYLGPLSHEDTMQYVLHRINVAGATKTLFAQGALELIYEYSGGIPRRINRLCDLSLLAGSQYGVESIDESFIKNQAQGLIIGKEGEGIAVTEVQPQLIKSTLPKAIEEPLIIKSLSTIDDDDSKQLYDTLLLSIENIFNQFRLKEAINTQVTYKIIEKIVEKLESGDNTILACAYKTATDDYLIAHSVNVCVLALKLGVARGMDKKQLPVIGLSALLHDVGLVTPLVTVEGLDDQIKSSTNQSTTTKSNIPNIRPQTGATIKSTKSDYFKKEIRE
jgi:general secretion pathway protein A